MVRLLHSAAEWLQRKEPAKRAKDESPWRQPWVYDGTDRGVLLADAAYGNDPDFRAGLTELELTYVVGIQSTTSAWEPGTLPLRAKRWSGTGRPPQLLRGDRRHRPISAEDSTAMRTA